MKQPRTLQEAITYFADEGRCLEYLAVRRWPDGVECPTCGRKDAAFLANQRKWQCKSVHPKRQFSVKVGTIFEDSPLGLDKWLPAVWMLTNDKNGISSYEVGRALGVTQKTAWFMLHRIRLAMQEGGSFFRLGGPGTEVEVDETYIGGKARNMHKTKREKTITGRGMGGKVAVMGLLQRHGKGSSYVRTHIVNNTRKRHLLARVRQHVKLGSEIHTDALASYTELREDYVHKVVDHAEAYVQDNVHTNGLENFWSLLKRGLRGTYISVEPFHLFRYLDEQAFRFNARKDEDGDGGRFRSVLSTIVGKRVTYKQLTGKSECQTRVN